jgi:4-hydroxy-tetrahydrodipicolinate synthase
MKNKLKKLKGIFPVIYCFFNKDNTLDKKLISEQIKLIVSIGSNGIASLGLATEVSKLSFREKKTIIELVAENTNHLFPTAVTIQGNSFQEYLKLIDVAKNNKANWIILQPLINKNTTDKDCFNFFNKLIPYTEGTITGIQNAKEYLGVGLTAKEIIYLHKKYNNFRAIKGEASSVFMQKEIKQYPNSLKVFNGRGGQEIVDNFLLGCSGIVPALDGADKFVKIYKHIKDKDFSKANTEYYKILPHIVFIMQSISTMICYGKRICAYRMGINKVYDRKPFLESTDYGIKKSKKIALELGNY